MRLRSLTLRNFRRFSEARLEFPDGVTAILGPNGAGKSTVLEAIAFALYGTAALRTGKDLVRTSSAAPSDPVVVELEAELGNQAVRIVRELRGRALAPHATIEANGVVLVPGGTGSAEAVDQEVLRRLGVDRETFCTSVLSLQGDLARLAAMRPLERKQMILRLAGVARLDAMLEEARRRRRAAEVTLEEARRHVTGEDVEAAVAAAEQAHAAAVAEEAAAAQQAQAAAAHNVAAQARLEAAQATARLRLEVESRLRHALEQQRLHQGLANRLAQEAEEAAQAATRAAALEPDAARLAAAEAALEAARADAEARRRLAAMATEAARLQAIVGAPLPVVPEGRPALATQAEALAAEQATLAARQAALQEQARRAQEHLHRLGSLGSDAPCPTCARPLEGHLDALRRHLDAELQAVQAQLEAARLRAQEAAAALQLSRAGLARIEAAERLQAAAQQRREQAAADLARVETEAARLAATRPPAPADEAACRATVVQAREAQRQREALLVKAARLADVQQQAALHKEAARQAEQTAAAARADPVLGQPDPLPAARVAAEQAGTAERVAAERLRVASATVAGAAERREAARARLRAREAARQRVAELETELAGWTSMAGRDGMLERFRDHLVGRVGPAISREASRLLGMFTAGRYTELVLDGDYRIFVAEDGVHFPLDRFSGGEQDLCHLALRIAVARLLCERAGAEVRFLALDEVFGSLDRERRDLVVAALQAMEGLYAQVLVVSHLEGLREALGSAIEVAADGLGARLQVVA